MNKNLWKILLTLCLSVSAFSGRAETPLSELPFSSGETLHYKLSYRGLLTSMIWSDIADASMTFVADRNTLDAYTGHQFILSLSTENYTKAEVIHPVRYTYTATVDKALEKTLLVEEIDRGRNQSHDFLWVDWQNNSIELFKKREKVPADPGFFVLDSDEVWEQDGSLSLPDFLTGFPPLADNKSYFIHKESGDKVAHSQVLEPLSLIYNLRILANSVDSMDNADIDTRKAADSSLVTEVAVAISDDIRLYRIEKMVQEQLVVGGKKYQTIQYKIQSEEKKENSFYIWLNNDNNKVPVRLSMEAPLGKLEIDLVKVSREVEHKYGEMPTQARKTASGSKS